MPQSSDFHLGADVIAVDGTRAGTLVSVLVESEGFNPRAIVVKNESSLGGRLLAEEKFFITDEFVVPMALIASVTHGEVRINLSAENLRRQPPYLSYRFKDLTRGEAALEEADFLGGGLGLPANSEEVANKPAGQIEIDRDENVMLGKTGRRLGQVRDLLYEHDELIGLVIRPEGFFKRDVVLPIRFISRADDLALFADLAESEVERLKPFADS